MDSERKPEPPSSNCPHNDTIFPFLTDSIADIDRNITLLENSASLYPRYYSERINCVYNLAEMRWVRYQLSNEKQDLNKSIVHCTEAILLPPISRDGPYLNNVYQLLFRLASALLERYEEFEQPEGVKYSIDYLWYLRGLPLDSFDIPRNDVTTSLIRALATQVELDAGDVTQNIKEMVVLCRELLASNMSTDFPIGAFLSFDMAIQTAFDRGLSTQLLDDAIECLRDAVRVCPPGSHSVLLALARRLFTRFITTYSSDDYEESTEILERILDPDLPGGCPDSIRVLASSLAAVLARFRSSIFENPEYSEVTMSRLRTLLSTPSINEGVRLQITNALAIQARERFQQYSLAENLEEANSYISQVVDLSSSESLEKSREPFGEPEAVRETYSTTRVAEKIQHLEELLSISPPGTQHHKQCLRDLADWYKSKFNRSNDISDVEKSIKYSRLSLDATRSSDPWRHIPLASLRNILDLAFQKTRKISYLDESITLAYDIL